MKIAIYQTSDLHGFTDLLKIGTYMRHDSLHYDASLRIDCGDLIQGSPLTHYLYKTKAETNPIMQAMTAIGYDAYVLGNHEFNYGMDYLRRGYEAVRSHIINANITGLPFETQPYKIFDLGGFKIACLGLTTSYIPHWEQPRNIENLSFEDPVKMYARYEHELKAHSDMIIVCYHGGFERSLEDNDTPTEKLTQENQGSELLRQFDSIDIVLSGHQHRSFITTIDKRICAQPMNNGRDFTKIVLDTQTKQLSYELIQTATLDLEIDTDLSDLFRPVEANLDIYLDQKIGTFSQAMPVDDLFEARLKGHPFINFLHQVQLEVSGADFSALSICDGSIGFEKEVSIRDVLTNYPYPNTLKVLKVTGQALKEAIETSLTYFVLEDGNVAVNPTFIHPKLQHYNYDVFGGLTYHIDLTRDFHDRVVEMKKNGNPIDLSAEYTIVLNNYRASNTAVYPSYENAQVIKEINLEVSELIIDYIQKHGEIHVPSESNYQINYQ